jgi:hypothetical protein
MFCTGGISVRRHHVVKRLALQKQRRLQCIFPAPASNPRRIHEANSFQTHENSLVNEHFS